MLCVMSLLWTRTTRAYTIIARHLSMKHKYKYPIHFFTVIMVIIVCFVFYISVFLFSVTKRETK